MERLSGLDASFLYLETPTHHMHVAVVLVFDPSTIPGGYSFDRIKRSIAGRLPSAPVLRRRLVEVPLRLGHPVWVDDPGFDIDAHVRLAAVPAPGGLAELGELAGEITSHQLDRSRPLWEIWLVEGMAGGRLGFIAKMHHSMVDGITGAALLTVLFDLEVEPAAAGPVPSAPDEEEIPSGLELASRALVARSLRPLEVTRDVVRTGRKLLDIRNIRVRSDNTEGRGKAALPLSAPRTSLNSALTRRRSVALTSIALDDVRWLKGATGTTVNDVVLAVCTGALRSHLQQGEELPEKPLVAVVPVSVHPDQARPVGSNLVSAMFVQLPTHLDDPLDRLQAIHEGTIGAKEEHDVLGPDLLQSWAEHVTPNVFTAGARLYSRMRLADRHRPIANLVVSNFKGPGAPLYLAGAELTAGYPLGPVMDGMGLNITVMTYRGVLYWGFHTSPDIVHSVSSLADAVPLALEELLERAGRPPGTPDRRTEA